MISSATRNQRRNSSNQVRGCRLALRHRRNWVPHGVTRFGKSRAGPKVPIHATQSKRKGTEVATPQGWWIATHGALSTRGIRGGGRGGPASSVGGGAVLRVLELNSGHARGFRVDWSCRHAGVKVVGKHCPTPTRNLVFFGEIGAKTNQSVTPKKSIIQPPPQLSQL